MPNSEYITREVGVLRRKNRTLEHRAKAYGDMYWRAAHTLMAVKAALQESGRGAALKLLEEEIEKDAADWKKFDEMARAIRNKQTRRMRREIKREKANESK